jgi:outer membrane protein W
MVWRKVGGEGVRWEYTEFYPPFFKSHFAFLDSPKKCINFALRVQTAAATFSLIRIRFHNNLEDNLMLRSIAKSVFALFMVAGLASLSFAQDDDMARPLTKSGSAAFVFNLSGFGTFGMSAQPIGTVSAGTTNQTVAGAGMKYYISDGGAIRILLAFATNDNGATDDASSVTGMQFGLGAAYEHHFGPLYSTSPYIGGGITYAMASQTSGTGTGESKMSGSQLGIGAIAGFDWYFTKGLALGAEYNLRYVMNSSSMESGGQDAGDQPSPSSIGIGGGASVHFIAHF